MDLIYKEKHRVSSIPGEIVDREQEKKGQRCSAAFLNGFGNTH